MAEPTPEVQVSFTKSELIREARRCARDLYPGDADVRHERLGLLVEFIGGLFYENLGGKP